MAKAQRDISVSEFFAKNRHLLGFDNPRKALLTTVKEAVDNSLDACEEAGILPVVEIWHRAARRDALPVTVQDNGPGIVRKQIPQHLRPAALRQQVPPPADEPRPAGHRHLGGGHVRPADHRQARADHLAAPARASPAHYYELQIDTRQNQPDIIKDEQVEWDVPHGTQVEIELEAKYQKGRQSVDDYLQQTAIANPHVTLVYHAPDGRVRPLRGQQLKHCRPSPKAISPHPHGVELGVLIKMLADTKARTVQQFLTQRVLARLAARGRRDPARRPASRRRTRPSRLGGEEAKAIYQAIQQTQDHGPVHRLRRAHRRGAAHRRACKQVVRGRRSTRPPRAARPSIAATRSSSRWPWPTASRPRTEATEDAGQAASCRSAAAHATAGDARGASREARSSARPTIAEPDERRARRSTSWPSVIRFANRVPLLYQQSALRDLQVGRRR